jgi:hypothetical protein
MPRKIRTSNPSVKQQRNQFNQNLPELALAEENQQVAMTPDDSLSPSIFTFRLRFVANHHH